MGVIYRFDLIGASGGHLGGHVVGDDTVDQALAWAFEHLASGEAVPVEIVCDGQLVYDAAQIQAAYERRPLPDELLARLAAVGGACRASAPSVWGSYEILTPATASYKYVWCSASGLAALLEEWEATPGYHPRLALIFLEAAKEARNLEHTRPPVETVEG